MITQGEEVEIHALRRQGWSISAIARHVGLDRKTVRAYLAGDREVGVRRRSAVDPFDEFEAYVRRRLGDDPHVRATVLFAEAQGLGYGASYPTFVRRIRDRGLRPVCGACLPQRTHTDIEHPPGEEIQWDWLELRDTPWGARAFVLVGVLSYSGQLRCWFSESTDQAHLVAGIGEVLARLGGTARRWRTDRMATVVAPGTDRVQASFAAVAKHYGAAVDVCPPRRPRRKGAVEKAIDYLTQSWWRTARAPSPEAAQASADRWCIEVSDGRPRRLDGAVVTVAQAAAGEALVALPTVAFPATLTLDRVAAANALVSVWGNRYSVPPELAGANVQVTHRLGAKDIEIRSNAGRIVATHRLAPRGAHRTVRRPEHTEALQAAVLGALDTSPRCRPKANRPPSAAAIALAPRLGDAVAEDPVIDLDIYRQLTQPGAAS